MVPLPHTSETWKSSHPQKRSIVFKSFLKKLNKSISKMVKSERNSSLLLVWKLIKLHMIDFGFKMLHCF